MSLTTILLVLFFFLLSLVTDRHLPDVLKQAAVLEEGQRPIYLDMQATTPVDPRVLDAMIPYYVGVYGNPHSRTHAYGWESEKAVEEAREHVARLIGADPKEIIFTSGATESNNMSIKGVARFFGRSGKKKHIITTQTEHKCVLDSCRHLQDDGFDVTYLPVQNNGLIKMEDLEAAIRPDTAIVSIMAVNNEIGVIQPMAEIGKLCREKKVFFHTDAAQAVGKIPMDVNAMNIDLMSISSHKIYGPKGIGACYVRRRPRVRLEPLIAGGGQERGLRSGTLAPPLVAGFGEACRIAYEEMDVSFRPYFLAVFFNYLMSALHAWLSEWPVTRPPLLSEALRLILSFYSHTCHLRSLLQITWLITRRSMTRNESSICRIVS